MAGQHPWCECHGKRNNGDENAVAAVTDQNQLTTLPESFGQLTVLQTLRLHQKQLTTLPESFGQLTEHRR